MKCPYCNGELTLRFTYQSITDPEEYGETYYCKECSTKEKEKSYAHFYTDKYGNIYNDDIDPDEYGDDLY